MAYRSTNMLTRPIAVLIFACLAFPAWGQTVLQLDDNGNPMQTILQYGSTRTITYTGGVSTVPAWAILTKAVDLVCSTDCHITQGQSPATANTKSAFVPAKVIVRLKVGPNDGIAVTRDTADGTIWVTELK